MTMDREALVSSAEPPDPTRGEAPRPPGDLSRPQSQVASGFDEPPIFIGVVGTTGVERSESAFGPSARGARNRVALSVTRALPTAPMSVTVSTSWTTDQRPRASRSIGLR
jgi:hypothetical protein